MLAFFSCVWKLSKSHQFGLHCNLESLCSGPQSGDGALWSFHHNREELSVFGQAEGNVRGGRFANGDVDLRRQSGCCEVSIILVLPFTELKTLDYSLCAIRLSYLNAFFLTEQI